MGKSLFGANPREMNGEIDQIAIDYKLKLIAFQDELFQSRKKLQDSDKRMVDLQKKLDEYVRNKENQIAEVLFTAHMNAQRIEAQTRSQTDYFILEMEEEMRRKEKEIELLQKKTNRFADETLVDSDTGHDNAARLQIVQDHIRAFKEQIETTKITDVSLENKKPAKVAKVANIAELPIDKKEQVFDTKEALSVESKDKVVVENNDQVVEAKIDLSLENKEQIIEAKAEQPLVNKEQSVETKVIDQPLVGKKRRVVSRKSDKSRINQDQIPTIDVAEEPAEVKDQISAESIIDNSQQYSMPAVPPDHGTEYSPIQSSSQMELNERMRLDAFVDARYYDNIAGQKQMQHHALQVTIEVDVPPDNYSVRYTKVSSDVVSTLLKFDNVVLNDVFPFNVIEPNPQNISIYFYNCVEDMLSLMDLELHSLTVLALPDIQIQVNSRNIKLDKFLHQDEDVLDNIRESLIPCVETYSEDISPLKGTLSRILGKRN